MASKRYILVKAQVRQLLKLSTDQYNLNVLEYSYAYLEHQGYDKQVIETLHQVPAYWLWWRNQFAIADMMYLNIHALFDYCQYPLSMQIEMYESCHIGIQAYPSRLIEKINALQTPKTKQTC